MTVIIFALGVILFSALGTFFCVTVMLKIFREQIKRYIAEIIRETLAEQVKGIVKIVSKHDRKTKAKGDVVDRCIK